MSNPKTLHNYTMMTFFIIGFSAFFAGFAWILAPEPWLLDEYANTILLDESYENLFAADINRNLPDYLTLLYRFFGWWVSLIGLLTIGYTYVTRLGTHISRITIQVAYFIGLTGIGIILYTFIPTTPFVYLNIYWRILKNKEDKNRYKERFGIPSISRPKNKIIWISKINQIAEFNIGHAVIAESLFYGLKDTIKKFKRAINK